MKTWADFEIDVPHGAGGEVDTTCPECSHTRRKKKARCLSVNMDKQTWFCHHCGWSGGLADGGKHPLELHWQKPKYRKPEYKPMTDLPEKVVEWFKERGISEKVLARNVIGYGPVWMPQVEDKVNAIQFPYLRDDEVVNVKYRDGRKNFRMEAGAERVLYGLNDVAETTIIVEGEMDKLSLEMAGYKNVVSVPDGAPTPNTKDYSSKFSFLEADGERLSAVKEWIIAVDSDEPGKRLEDELARRLGREKCKRVEWPQGYKDANEVLKAVGGLGLGELIRQAKPFPIDGVFTALDVSEKIDQLYRNGFERGVETGWPSVDSLYSVRPGEFTVITGIPNSGKSNWMDALAINLCKDNGWRIAMFSPENQPIEDHHTRLIEKWSGFPFAEGPTPRMDEDTKDMGKSWLSEHIFSILPSDDTDWTVDEILERAKSLVFQKGIRGLVIDPWNELEHDRPDGVSLTEYISRELKRVRQFARRHGVHVWIVAHPAKLYKDKDGNYPVPTPYDISDSAHWRNKADNCISIWRDFGDNTSRVVEVHIQKIRFKQIGKLGMAELAWNHVVGTYHETQRANAEIPASYHDAG